MLQTLDALVRERLGERAIQLLADDGLKRAVDQRRFTAARYACHANKRAQREVHVHILEVVSIAATKPYHVAIARTAHLRNFYLLQSAQIIGGERAFFEHLLRSARKHHITASTPRFRAYIHNIIGIEHHVFVVLHHYHGVALVAQFFQRRYEAFAITLMQTDARLVENVKHIHQLRAYLCSQTNTLTFTTRERSR